MTSSGSCCSVAMAEVCDGGLHFETYQSQQDAWEVLPRAAQHPPGCEAAMHQGAESRSLYRTLVFEESTAGVL